MRSIVRIFIQIIMVLFPISGNSQNIFRFEHIGTEEGLSQNTAFNILFDSKGFMWIGTYNGLNRYDGYEFKIYRSSSENGNNFTNNRVTKLWEDKRGFVWLETYDGYYHFFNPETEIFSSLPLYEGSKVKNGAMHSFLQYSKDIIILGSSNSGIFYLRYDSLKRTYLVRQNNSQEGSYIPDNNIRFIHADNKQNLWIGTTKGLSYVRKEEIGKTNLTFDNQFANTPFTSVCETNKKLFFGTENRGIFVLDKASKEYSKSTTISYPGFRSDRISSLHSTKSGLLVSKEKGQ
jgi:ligand-binding sensor domain-containing protein